jgi:hypothetical protein
MKDEEESDGKKTAAGTQDVLTTTEVAVAAMEVEYSIGDNDVGEEAGG